MAFIPILRFHGSHRKISNYIKESTQSSPLLFYPQSLPCSDQTSPIDLSTEQKSLLSLLKSGVNVYFTGKAGSGKTEVLRQFIQHLRKMRTKIGLTAPTGAAASLV
jgi:hypothetical protein